MWFRLMMLDRYHPWELKAYKPLPAPTVGWRSLAPVCSLARRLSEALVHVWAMQHIPDLSEEAKQQGEEGGAAELCFLVDMTRPMGRWIQLNRCPGFLSNARCVVRGGGAERGGQG